MTFTVSLYRLTIYFVKRDDSQKSLGKGCCGSFLFAYVFAPWQPKVLGISNLVRRGNGNGSAWQKLCCVPTVQPRSLWAGHNLLCKSEEKGVDLHHSIPALQRALSPTIWSWLTSGKNPGVDNDTCTSCALAGERVSNRSKRLQERWISFAKLVTLDYKLSKFMIMFLLVVATPTGVIINEWIQ